jgi:hypothetical protein
MTSKSGKMKGRLDRAAADLFLAIISDKSMKLST